MKQRITPLLLLLSLLWITACSSDNDNNPSPTQGSEVQFNMGFAPATRVATDVAFNSSFEDGDQIGIFALKAGTNTNPVAQNVKLTRQADGSWASSQKIYYPLDGSNLDFYAYYPYQGDGNTTMDKLSFAVQANQSTAANYSQSNLLTASAMDQSSNLVGLSFGHLMAMVQVTTKGESPVPTFRKGDEGFEVVLKNAKHSTTAIHWTANAAELDPSATAQDIRMYRMPTADGTWVFRALIPSQELAAGALFEFKQTLTGNVIDMGYSIAAPVSPAKGKAASYKVTLDYQLDADHKYALGDVYPYKGTPVGIVFWLDPAGDSKKGKIVSLDEGQNLQWGPADVTTSATNTDNGITNMAIIKNMTGWEDNYPAFAWCAAKGDNWYLPAKDELKALYAGYSGKRYEGINGWVDYNEMPGNNEQACIDARTAFNSKLTAAGGTAFTGSWVWSGSENYSNDAWAVRVSNGDVGSASKRYTYRVRAVRAF